jgi:hypothetical protein
MHAIGNSGGATVAGANLICYSNAHVALENTSASGSIFLKTNSADSVQITPSGNVRTFGTKLYVGRDRTDTAAIGMEMGTGRTDHGQCYLDFTTEALEADYNARIIRKENVNGDFEIINTGTGEINLGPSAIKLESTAANGINLEVNNGAGGGIVLNTVQSSAIVLKTLNTERLRFTGTGNVEFNVSDFEINAMDLDLNLGGWIDADVYAVDITTTAPNSTSGITINSIHENEISLKTDQIERLKVRGTGGVECDNITPSDTSDTPTATQPVDSSNAMNAVLARGYVDWDYTDGANGTATVRTNHWNVDYIETLIGYPSRVKVWLDDDCDMDSSISVQVDPTGAPGQSLDKDWLHCVRAQWETTKSFLVHMRQMKDTDYTFHNRGYNFSFIVIGKKG